MDDRQRPDGSRPARPYTAVVRASRDWDGFVVVLGTEPDRCPSLHADLSEVIGCSHGGVLRMLTNPWPWPGAPVVGVALRRGRDGALGPVLWLGPLAELREHRALCGWLRRGGPAGGGGIPIELQHRILLHPPGPAVALQTMN